MNKEIVIVGRVDMDVFVQILPKQLDYTIHGFADDNHELGDLINGFQVVANTFEDIKDHCQPGFRHVFCRYWRQCRAGKNLWDGGRSGLRYALDYSPHSGCLAPRHIGQGTVIMPGAVVNANASDRQWLYFEHRLLC